VLNEEQRNGLINTEYRWPNKEVPFVIDDVFSKYCSTKLQIGIRGVEGNIRALQVPLYLQYTLRWSGRNIGDNYLSLPLETITHTHTCQTSHGNITKCLRSL
jgi:hypothetical protein